MDHVPSDVLATCPHLPTRWNQHAWTRWNTRVSTRLKKPVRPIHKGRRPSAASTKGGGLRPPPLWNPLWMGLTGFFKRVETRMFQRVQARWFQRVGRCGQVAKTLVPACQRRWFQRHNYHDIGQLIMQSLVLVQTVRRSSHLNSFASAS